MKKIIFCLTAVSILVCISLFSLNQIGKERVEDYRELLKDYADKDSFLFSQETEFEWDKAVAFKFPVSKENFENVLGVNIDFDYDLKEGIVFIKDGKIVFKDVYSSDPEHPSDINYELTEENLAVYNKETLISVEKRNIDFYFVKETAYKN